MDAGPPIIVVDLGGTNLRVGLVEPTGAIIERVREPNREEDGPERVADRIVEAGRELLAKHGLSEAMGLGAAVASPLDKDGVLYNPPNLQSWGVVPFRELLAARFDGPVLIGNDATVACLGEYVFGQGRGMSDLIYLTVSTGVGGGVISHGTLLSGYRGLGPELGHLIVDREVEDSVGEPGVETGPCGHAGCLEMMTSGTAIAMRARAGLEGGAQTSLRAMALGNPDAIEAEHVFRAAAAGDSFATEVMETAARDLAFGLVSLVHAFNPRRIVLGGSVALHNWEMLGPIVEARVREHTFPSFLEPFDIVLSEFGDDVGLIGAAALVAHRRGG